MLGLDFFDCPDVEILSESRKFRQKMFSGDDDRFIKQVL